MMKGRNIMANKDWTGNKNSIYKTLGASNHTEEVREVNDYYATEPRALELLLEKETFDNNIWECACGEGHLCKVLEEKGYNVTATDLIDRGYGTGGKNFLTHTEKFDGDIITNPPYKHALAFAQHALKTVTDGHKVALFLKLQFLEGKARRKFFDEHPPKVIYVASSRLLCAKNGEFQKMKDGGGSAVAYAWFIWEKNFTGDPIIKWFN